MRACLGLTQTEARQTLNLSKSSGIKLDKDYGPVQTVINDQLPKTSEVRGGFMDALYNMWCYIAEHKYGFIFFIVVACVIIALLVIIYKLIQSHHDEMMSIMRQQQKEQEEIAKERDYLKKQVGKLEATVSKLEAVVKSLDADKKQAEERYEFIMKSKVNVI